MQLPTAPDRSKSPRPATVTDGDIARRAYEHYIARVAANTDMTMRTTQDLVSRIRAEYLDMPGMRLTIQQVKRLYGIEQTLCKTVLDSLVDSKFLCVKLDGAYSRPR